MNRLNTPAAVADARVGDLLDDRTTWGGEFIGRLIDNGAHAEIVEACRNDRETREEAGAAPAEDADIEDESAAAFYIGLAIGRRTGGAQ